MTKQLGPTFGNEVNAAGIGGLAFSWGATDDSFHGRENLTVGQNATLDEVVAAHDPSKTVVPAVISNRQFFQALALRGTISKSDAKAVVKSGTLPKDMQNAIDAMPPDQQFEADMMLSGGAALERAHPMIDPLMTSSFGYDAQMTDDLWRYAVTL